MSINEKHTISSFFSPSARRERHSSTQAGACNSAPPSPLCHQKETSNSGTYFVEETRWVGGGRAQGRGIGMVSVMAVHVGKWLFHLISSAHPLCKSESHCLNLWYPYHFIYAASHPVLLTVYPTNDIAEEKASISCLAEESGGPHDIEPIVPAVETKFVVNPMPGRDAVGLDADLANCHIMRYWHLSVLESTRSLWRHVTWNTVIPVLVERLRKEIYVDNVQLFFLRAREALSK
ncbi:uncharacterized protein BT62DRAFT_990176 [Guyanagaster necrorhizus]|uniref:Uncharacterized protein n=1 Tax=Guyanagaster necrorhizus TaxID=856835 RepID=A0A9P7W5J8_9AGAR|nr:uncharacterized protein BT62DRAFT_990176 [Guyanagaster necrorhizus MCA 3950]KAG7451691.1 hypothetical protein BT62DRAFT_990176 [Guyanagaster necrorhizus MCA 3950]